MRTLSLALLSLSILAISGVCGCDGDVTTQTGGTGGSGGATGGSGGAGAMGGGGAESCPPAESVFLGFKEGNPSSGTMTLTEVTPTAISMVPENGDVEVTFHWVGADVTQIFAAGDTITIDVPQDPDSEWYVLTGESAFAAAVQLSNITFFTPQKFPIPHGGPEISFTSECKIEYSCDFLGTCYNSIDSLVVGAGQDAVTVLSNQLVTVGDYQIYNNRNVDHYVTPEATQERSFTVIGPVPPP